MSWAEWQFAAMLAPETRRGSPAHRSSRAPLASYHGYASGYVQ